MNQLKKQLKILGTARPSEEGLTLMESLIAVVMVSAVAVAITPPIFLSVATRVQNRRAEQALQLAHGQIDQVRVLVEQGLDASNIEQLPALAAGAASLDDVNPPGSEYSALQSTNYSCSDYDVNPKQVPVNQALPIDINGDCEADFFVQTFRYKDVEGPITPGVPIVFNMGVRVYYRNAELQNAEKKQASLKLTTGEGQQRTHPLAVMSTALAQGDKDGSLDGYRQFLE
ncbi:hypothetical protein [Zarconia navalis]|nr:hypothetical protein [Zarconia navalis]